MSGVGLICYTVLMTKRVAKKSKGFKVAHSAESGGFVIQKWGEDTDIKKLSKSLSQVKISTKERDVLLENLK